MIRCIEHSNFCFAVYFGWFVFVSYSLDIINIFLIFVTIFSILVDKWALYRKWILGNLNILLQFPMPALQFSFHCFIELDCSRYLMSYSTCQVETKIHRAAIKNPPGFHCTACRQRCIFPSSRVYWKWSIAIDLKIDKMYLQQRIAFDYYA